MSIVMLQKKKKITKLNSVPDFLLCPTAGRRMSTWARVRGPVIPTSTKLNFIRKVLYGNYQFIHQPSTKISFFTAVIVWLMKGMYAAESVFEQEHLQHRITLEGLMKLMHRKLHDKYTVIPTDACASEFEMKKGIES